VLAHLKTGPAEAKRWAARQIASAAIGRARTSGDLDAAAIRSAIDQRVTDIFRVGGSPSYRRTVHEIRTMAAKVATARRLETPPVIDGVADQPVWNRGNSLGDFIVYGQATAAQHVTRVRLLHDGTALYVALVCEQDTSELVTDAAPRDGATWEDDSVEIFINPGPEQYPYAQFIINAAGAFFDLRAERHDQTYGERRDYDFDAVWAAKLDEERWTAELRLPLAEFGCPPATHSVLLVDFVRNVQGDEAEISAWFPSTGSHADPDARGWLILE